MESQTKVLIIEDEEDIRAVYTEVLEVAGYKVLEAPNGEVGLELALAGDWDLMLLDIVIPKIDGVTLLKKLNATDSIKNKPIILLTNLGSDHLITECFELGASGYLIKAEITPDKILNELEGYFNDKNTSN
jgi:two-component system, OmpR family, response regulator ResD